MGDTTTHFHLNKTFRSVINVFQEYKSQSDFDLASSVEKDQCKVQYFICKRLFSLQSLYTFLNEKQSRLTAMKLFVICICFLVTCCKAMSFVDIYRAMNGKCSKCVEYFYSSPCLTVAF